MSVPLLCASHVVVPLDARVCASEGNPAVQGRVVLISPVSCPPQQTDKRPRVYTWQRGLWPEVRERRKRQTSPAIPGSRHLVGCCCSFSEALCSSLLGPDVQPFRAPSGFLVCTLSYRTAGINGSGDLQHDNTAEFWTRTSPFVVVIVVPACLGRVHSKGIEPGALKSQKSKKSASALIYSGGDHHTCAGSHHDCLGRYPPGL